MSDVNEVRRLIDLYAGPEERAVAHVHVLPLVDFARSVIEPPEPVREAMERLRKWLKAHNTQAKFDIYRGHKFGDRMGGLDYDALMAAYRHDLRILADWALSLTAPTPETTK